MIIAWVLSLLVLISSLIASVERVSALEILSMTTAIDMGRKWISAEKALQECEQHLANIAELMTAACHIQSAGKDLWLISRPDNPKIEILVHLDSKTHLATRLSWRQQFE